MKKSVGKGTMDDGRRTIRASNPKSVSSIVHRPSSVSVALAFAAIYIIWGSTYLAIRYAIETMPPLLMAGTRFLFAGGVLYAWMRLRGTPRPTRLNWRGAAIIGGLLLLGGNGGVVLAEQSVPSGLTALLVAMVPVWIVLVDWARPGGSRPTVRIWAGLALGVAGVVLLIGPGEIAGGKQIDLLGAATVMVGSLGWATGTVFTRFAGLPASGFMSTAIQMLAGGALLLGTGLITGEWSKINLANVSVASLGAWFYLVVFGSLVAFSTYVWLLRVTTPARIGTYAYVNPVVAVMLGWAFVGEPLTPRTLIAAAVIIGAVVIINTARMRTTDAGRRTTDDGTNTERTPEGGDTGVAQCVSAVVDIPHTPKPQRGDTPRAFVSSNSSIEAIPPPGD